MDMQLFESSNQEKVRTIYLNGNAWLLAIDVCAVLDLQNPSAVVDNLDADEKLLYSLVLFGQRREVWFISESGLYALTTISRKDEAKKFRKWLTSEVIPQIRRTGSYKSSFMPAFIKRVSVNFPRIDKLFFLSSTNS